jgi:hypothetical protein
MLEGYKICTQWKIKQVKPDLPIEEILDSVSDTVVEMSIENGKMARTLHDIMLKVFKETATESEEIKYIRNVIIGNLGRNYAYPFSEEEH